MIYTSLEMVAQSSANFPIFRGHVRQRGRGFGALAQTLGRTAIPLIKKYIAQLQKESEQIYLKLLLQRLEKLSGDEKKLETFAKDVGTKTVRKQLGGGKKKSKRRTRRAISRKSSLKISRSRKDIFDKIK